ncbi:MAG TPA: PrsW family intramembrane metalloprotease [Acidobacteriota bacterium]|nr:PrsW family intramembrane metalloprotease [Acidobacteriota bacterium]
MNFILHWIVVFLSVLAAFIPMVAYLFLVWWMDRYYRQPVWLVASVFLWGAIGAVMIGVAGSRFFTFPVAAIFGERVSGAFGSIIVAPIVEEIAKGCILFIAMLRADSDGPADGIVLGAAAGLGFGMTENYLYFTQVYDASGFIAWASNVYVRTLYSAVVHCVCSATLGMAIGIARNSTGPKRLRVAIAGLLVAMGIHSFWNISMVAKSAMLIQIAFTVMPFLVLLLLVVYQYFLYREGEWIRTELNEEALEGTISPTAVSFIVSPWKRFRNNDPKTKQYVTSAMKLAWKRHHWKRAVGIRKERLWLALLDLRQSLKRIQIFDHSVS